MDLFSCFGMSCGILWNFTLFKTLFQDVQVCSNFQKVIGNQSLIIYFTLDEMPLCVQLRPRLWVF